MKIHYHVVAISPTHTHTHSQAPIHICSEHREFGGAETVLNSILADALVEFISFSRVYSC